MTKVLTLMFERLRGHEMIVESLLFGQDKTAIMKRDMRSVLKRVSRDRGFGTFRPSASLVLVYIIKRVIKH